MKRKLVIQRVAILYAAFMLVATVPGFAQEKNPERNAYFRYLQFIPMQSFVSRFTMICGSSIPNGFKQMVNRRCVILTRRG